MDQQTLIRQVVEQVLTRIPSYSAPAPRPSAPTAVSPASPSPAPSATVPTMQGPGLFSTVDAAVTAATASQKQLAQAGLAVRDGIQKLIKRMARENAPQWGQIELMETKVGRLDHKIAKLELLEKVPGVEFLKTDAHSGDAGVGLDEAAPWGVIGAITPVTHSIPTMSANAIAMISAGNAMVINAHPSGANCLAMAAVAYNQAISEQFGIDPLICVVHPPTLRTAEELFQHPGVPLLVVTGGPAVARAAMKQAKRAIVAGPGNPPVVVDETADLDRAARSILLGAAFDNNLLCIGEKEVFVVESVMDDMIRAMANAGAMVLNDQQIASLTKAAFVPHGDHLGVNKDFVGKDPQVLGQLAGFDVPAGVELLVGITEESSPFVAHEQMMPFVPFVKVKDFEQGLSLALKHEHGFGHTAILHSNNLGRITRMGQAVNTTIFVVNGPCVAGLGSDGQGYPSYSIATPTGEGITNPMTFTRFRRGSFSRSMRIV